MIQKDNEVAVNGKLPGREEQRQDVWKGTNNKSTEAKTECKLVPLSLVSLSV